MRTNATLGDRRVVVMRVKVGNGLYSHQLMCSDTTRAHSQQK